MWPHLGRGSPREDTRFVVGAKSRVRFVAESQVDAFAADRGQRLAPISRQRRVGLAPLGQRLTLPGTLDVKSVGIDRATTACRVPSR